MKAKVFVPHTTDKFKLPTFPNKRIMENALSVVVRRNWDFCAECSFRKTNSCLGYSDAVRKKPACELLGTFKDFKFHFPKYVD